MMWPGSKGFPSASTGAPGGDDAVELYVRTYNTMLRSSGDIPIRAFEPAHMGVGSSLHALAAQPGPDAGAFIYSIQRLPACVVDVERVVIGQLPEQFQAEAGGEMETWMHVSAPGRRRVWSFDGQRTLAVSIASTSDVDDVIPTLVAYQIEWNKLYAMIRRTLGGADLDPSGCPPEESLDGLGPRLGFSVEDWQRLRRIWGASFWTTLCAIARGPKDMRIRMLGGTHVGYAKLVDRWWGPVQAQLAGRKLIERPTYFVSSNPHSIVNLLSGYVRRRADSLWQFLDQAAARDDSGEFVALRAERGRSNPDNVLYYASRLWHQRNNGAPAKLERAREEGERGIVSIAASGGLDVGAQIIDLGKAIPGDLDPRLKDLREVLDATDAVIINIDYPLGMAAYYILRRVAEQVGDLRGVYVLGKAATLNGAVGDAMIANVVIDEHTHNEYVFNNAFDYRDVAPWLERGSVLDNQKAVTVRGTFLQNRDFLEMFYREAYTVVEMEAGPYLAAVYECAYPDRHPFGQTLHFRDLPFDLGFIHYASDTPYTRARTLGGRRLSFEGIDSTYGSTVAILRRILAMEAARLR